MTNYVQFDGGVLAKAVDMTDRIQTEDGEAAAAKAEEEAKAAAAAKAEEEAKAAAEAEAAKETTTKKK